MIETLFKAGENSVYIKNLNKLVIESDYDNYFRLLNIKDLSGLVRLEEPNKAGLTTIRLFLKENTSNYFDLHVPIKKEMEIYNKLKLLIMAANPLCL